MWVRNNHFFFSLSPSQHFTHQVFVCFSQSYMFKSDNKAVKCRVKKHLPVWLLSNHTMVLYDTFFFMAWRLQTLLRFVVYNNCNRMM